jgi:death-on-curing protein
MTEVIWIELPEVLAIHGYLIDEHGGASGVRDGGLLESALARPQQLYSYGNPDVFDLAAAYTVGIISNHPFVDGNKRTGFVEGILFLELNGPTFAASEADAAQAVFGLAAGEITGDEFANWLRSNATLP